MLEKVGEKMTVIPTTKKNASIHIFAYFSLKNSNATRGLKKHQPITKPEL
ncbi:hypothetical protein PHEL49_2619 [Polaribacter sp. Hel1_33_49]|nr:hypothetical protein PHEL49_2619 [Polaribacter sp. Hel1_33_49]